MQEVDGEAHSAEPQQRTATEDPSSVGRNDDGNDQQESTERAVRPIEVTRTICEQVAGAEIMQPSGPGSSAKVRRRIGHKEKSNQDQRRGQNGGQV